jgi:hypothetical protein
MPLLGIWHSVFGLPVASRTLIACAQLLAVNCLPSIAHYQLLGRNCSGKDSGELLSSGSLDIIGEATNNPFIAVETQRIRPLPGVMCLGFHAGVAVTPRPGAVAPMPFLLIRPRLENRRRPH